MSTIELTLDEIVYLGNTLRMMRGSGQPTGLKEGEDLAGSILDKLENI